MYITTSEIENELADIEKRRFYLAMIDKWDSGILDIDRKLWEREHELKEMLKERGNVE